MDNKSVIVVWENLGGRDKFFNDFMKDLFKPVCENNIDFRLQYIPSSLNDADAQSVSLVDSKLSVESWSRIKSTYGPRTVDLMSLDSNALTTVSGVKKLNDDSGLVFNHTFGKTLRGGSNKCNTFVLKRCDDKIVCPVSGHESYYTFMKNHEISLKSGYLFRIITESGRVLEKHVSYSSIYERIRGYLIILGIFEGEPAHSMRAGSAIMLALSDNSANTQSVMNHIG
ncbi:unnamed protein product [Mytilus coruscus]|uniref:Uncharacterized protein n=1 Tax=Mytilus coruscus TaxID=42192 RepID=A0A6J8A0L3_MYTCO|nr:unnamed protein product [Mytilus coruscus]